MTHMTQKTNHFEVDKEGLAKLMARRPKGYVVLELLQNAWDENVRVVSLELEYKYGSAFVSIEDDSPEGFADLTHAYTLFAESRKKGDPTKRGRFNIGEKLVIAICEEAQLKKTKGTVEFDKKGRLHSKQTTEFGTIFTGRIRMTKEEFVDMTVAAQQVIPLPDVETRLNGDLLPKRTPLETFTITLPTEVAGEDGYLRRSERQTFVEVYEPLDIAEMPQLYEMGIPVVGTDDTWHVNIMQKVPLNSDRDNVTPSYLRKVRTAVLNHMAEQVPVDDVAGGWVGDALESKDVDQEAVRFILEKQYGSRRVVNDPSDPESNKRAMAAGYTVIPARAFNAQQWQNIREAGAARPAGQVTPSPKPFHADGTPLNIVPGDQWPNHAIEMAGRLADLASELVDGKVSIRITNDKEWPFNAACGPDRVLYINLYRFGWSWFESIGQRQLELLIHELAHIRVSDHLSDGYAHELCRLGAKLALTVHGKETLGSTDDGSS